ncbi:MAG TPA: sulfotransferase domain-containing protein, partial [Gemmatimonadales bacterium]|nr:sulfotransferase domain-containing protein [Gemmatimonadales bacterium]
ATNVGRMAPPPAAFEEWYCSPELMWWGTWTDHVLGWWDRSQKDGNVLFLYFEDLKRDLPAIVRQVAGFLGVKPLTDQELQRVVEKCGFAYMQEHKNNFEMQPPHLMQTNADLFVRGTADRHKDVAPEVRKRLGAWAAQQLDGSAFPLRKVYPDVIGEASR